MAALAAGEPWRRTDKGCAPPRGPGSVAIAVEPNGERGIVVTVQDSGPGLPEGVDLFAAFSTTKAHGTGLGLAIARQVVEAHGGTITAESVQPHGARFCIHMPTRPPAKAEQPRAMTLSA